LAIAGSVVHPSLGAQRENGNVTGDYSDTLLVHTAKREAFDEAQNLAFFYGRVLGFVLRLLA
jgi:hypothetical protein